jgi:hypothetical protein
MMGRIYSLTGEPGTLWGGGATVFASPNGIRTYLMVNRVEFDGDADEGMAVITAFPFDSLNCPVPGVDIGQTVCKFRAYARVRNADGSPFQSRREVPQ